MRQRSSGTGWLLPVTLAVAALVSGCVVVPAHGYRPAHSGQVVGGPAPQPVAQYPVMMAPPAPQVEVVGVAPGPGFFWIGGYWNWVGNRHIWVSGRWETHRPGYHWVPHQWHQRGNGWHQEHGRWEQRR